MTFITEEEAKHIIGKPKLTLDESLRVLNLSICCDICLRIKTKGVQFYINNGDRWITICKHCIKQLHETIQE